MPRVPNLRVLFLLSLPLLPACREGSENQAADFLPIVASAAGTQGCAAGVDAPATVTPLFSDAELGPLSQLAAAAAAEILYWTGADGSVHELDLTGAPADSVLVAPGVIESAVLVPAGIAAQATPSGIAVFDEQFLVVADHTSHSLVSVRRDVPDTVAPLAGLVTTTGGYSDGSGGGIRFNFGAPAPLLVDSFGLVYVGDSENHVLRRIELGAIPESDTLTGSGAPGDNAGPLPVTELDTPSGLAAACSGELYIVEAGTAGLGGHRLLSLGIGAEDNFFGGFAGSALALAGDGTEETTGGTDTAAHLARPQGLVVTQDGLAYWVDADEGILRRYDLTTGVSDCPLFADCAAAVTAGGSFAGTRFSLALGASGTLYVLECDSGTLYSVEP
jgi:hypothetical protein